MLDEHALEVMGHEINLESPHLRGYLGSARLEIGWGDRQVSEMK